MAANDKKMFVVKIKFCKKFNKHTCFTKLVKIKVTLLSLLTARYDFEANKKNNLIFYGLPSDQRETPNSLVTKVKFVFESSLEINSHKKISISFGND